MARHLTISKTEVPVADTEDETTTIVRVMINIMTGTCQMNGETQARFWRGMNVMLDGKCGEVIEIADSDYDEIKKAWLGIDAEKMPLSPLVGEITEMLNGATEADRDEAT